MKIYFIIPTIVALTMSACAQTKVYSPVVDPASIKNPAKYSADLNECELITANVDYSNEKNVSALKGAGLAVGAVGTGAAVVAGTGGLVLASVAWPIAIIGAGVGAVSNRNKTNNNEQKMRVVVFNGCLKQRGYEVLSRATGYN